MTERRSCRSLQEAIRKPRVRDVKRNRLRGAAQRGFTLIEMIAALAIAAILIAGIATLLNTSLNDTRAQQAAAYQSQMATAAVQLLQQNYSALSTTATAATPVVIPLNGATYSLSTYLSSSMLDTNPYGQTPCLLVYLGADGTSLQGLLVTEGGEKIDDAELGYAAGNAGKGGGSIPVTNNAAGAALGAFGTWSITKPNPASASCSGTETTFGHLVSQVFYNGAQSQNADYLYRVQVPNDPAANTMQVPIVLDTTQTDYAACTSLGAIAADAAGNIVNCQTDPTLGTVWQPRAAYHWLGTAATYSALATSFPAPHAGDVAMTLAVHRAYTFNGTSWQPLNVDSNGVMLMGGSAAVAIGEPCGPTDTADASAASDASETEVSTDSIGEVLSCQSGTWQTQSAIRAGTTTVGCTLIMQSAGADDYPTCSQPSGGAYTTYPWSYNSTNGTYSYTNTVTVTLTKPGIIAASAWAHMNDGVCGSKPGDEAQVSQSLDILDDTNTSIAHNESQSATLTDDSGGINNTLTQSGNAGTYTVEVTTNWASYAVITTPWTSSYCSTALTPIANTPIAAGWTVNSYY